MKRNLRLSAIILAMVMLTSVISPLITNAVETDMEVVYQNDTFTMYKDEDSYRFYGTTGDLSEEYNNDKNLIKSAEDYYESQGIKSKNVASTGASSLPSSVDLSQSKYFPPVGDQGGLGSCATFSCVYYQMSFEMNKNRDVVATYENTASPQLVFNFVSAGGDIGTTYTENYEFLHQYGAAPMSVLPYSDDDQLNWYATKEVWRESARYRLKDYQEYDNIGIDDKQITSPDDPDLIAYKTALNDGKILGYSTYVYSWVTTKLKTNPNAPENSKFAGEYSVMYTGGSDGPHRMAIVGYNDDIWTDLNNNNKVDSGEMGAFKIVNSWGESYCNKGFAWVAYDALNQVTSVEGGYSGYRQPTFELATSINAREYNESSDIYIQYTLNTAKRTQHEIVVTAEKNGTITTKQVFWGLLGYKSEDNEGAFDGTTVAHDGTFIYPIDNLIENFSPDEFGDYSWSIEFKDTNADSNPLIVKDIQLVNEKTGESFAVSNNLPCTLDGSSSSFDIKDTALNNKVIYYVGYDNPTLNYKIGDGDFNCVKMEENLERIGSTHKYIIENVTEDVTLYFTDENGNVDDNSSEYFTASDRLNFYRTNGVRDKVSIKNITLGDKTPDVLERFFFKPVIEGGYAPYNEQYTVENLDTGEVRYIYYNQASEKSFAFYKAGNYKITAEVTDQAGDVATFIQEMYVEDLPFEFDTLTAEKDVMFVGDSVKFNAVTKNEAIISHGPVHSKYLFEVKDENSNVVYSQTKESDKYHMGTRISHISFQYIPEKAGNYTLTVSSTDQNKQLAEKTISYIVYDKIYGDSNADGSVNIMDATNTQRYIASVVTEDFINSELADCDLSGDISIIDATLIQRYLASLSNTEQVGKIIEYIPPVKPTEPTEPTQPETEPTEKPTDPPVTKNTVTFTNSFKWSGTIYCYYWSDSNTGMTSWPGAKMTNAGTNEFGETLYTFDVPSGATYIIFSNGSTQTTDINYNGGEIRYYPIAQTDSKGHNLVETW